MRLREREVTRPLEECAERRAIHVREPREVQARLARLVRAEFREEVGPQVGETGRQVNRVLRRSGREGEDRGDTAVPARVAVPSGIGAGYAQNDHLCRKKSVLCVPKRETGTGTGTGSGSGIGARYWERVRLPFEAARDREPPLEELGEELVDPGRILGRARVVDADDVESGSSHPPVETHLGVRC